MKGILRTLGAAVLAGMPHAALALDADLTLDRFPGSGPGAQAVSGTRERRDDVDDGRRGSVHHVREGRSGEGYGYDGGARRDRGWASSSGWHEAGRYRSSGSLIELRALGGAVDAGSYYGTGGTARSSVIVIGAPETFGPIASIADGAARGGAKVLDVEADRLDRQAYGRNGLSTAHVGTAKIIRIAPDFRRGMAEEWEPVATRGETPFAELAPEERAVTIYPDTDMGARPVDPPARRVAETAPPPAPAVPTPRAGPAPTSEAVGFLEPWTAEWLRDCVARHPGFDASLGTYQTDTGQRRFCTGEP